MSRIIGVACATLALVACGGGNNSVDMDSSPATLTIMISDAAVDNVDAVWVEFAGVAIRPQIGDEVLVTFDLPKRIDLLELQDGRSEALLEDYPVPVGPYLWIRLDVNADLDGVFDSSALLNDGSEVELFIPSGSETGLKLVSGFTVTANQSTNIMLDWDLRKALSDPKGQPGMHLRPALRVTDMAIWETRSICMKELLRIRSIFAALTPTRQ